MMVKSRLVVAIRPGGRCDVSLKQTLLLNCFNNLLASVFLASEQTPSEQRLNPEWRRSFSRLGCGSLARLCRNFLNTIHAQDSSKNPPKGWPSHMALYEATVHADANNTGY